MINKQCVDINKYSLFVFEEYPVYRPMSGTSLEVGDVVGSMI